MNNFEEALEKIELLEKENYNLKAKLKAALWNISNSSVEELNQTIDNQIKFDSTLEKRMSSMNIKKEEAMQRFSKRLKNEARKFREARNGKTK